MTPFLPLLLLAIPAGGFGLFALKRRRDRMADLDGQTLSMHDAAENALSYLEKLGSPLVAIARASGSAIAWFEANLRRQVPGERVSSKQLRDYLSWARTVQ
ncbi:MAG TPA: hypothetical protein VGF56_08360 [Rhizomicrobium sp.]|jgi:hypothetical protein